ncbi:hypothetical protein CW713_02390 [Methanophagales archaeon]|nr:MAG: hypothetical protein CW713_02390 [Methanophagales archaeon]
MKVNDTEIEERLKEITKLYLKVRELMLYADELHPEKKTFIPPINEIRNAFDHLMRVFAVKFELKTAAKEDYITNNLEGALRHVYRAAFDLLDYVSINLRNKILDEINEISTEALNVVFPEYYQKIRPDIEKASTEISDFRYRKDMGDPKIDDVKKYAEIIDRIKSYLDKTLEIRPSLIAYEERKKKEVRKSKFLEILIYIAIAIVSGVIGAVLYAYF